MFLKIENPDKKYDGRVVVIELPRGHVEYMRLCVDVGPQGAPDRRHIGDVIAECGDESRMVYIADPMPSFPQKDGVLLVSGTGLPAVYTNWNVTLMNDQGKYIERLF